MDDRDKWAACLTSEKARRLEPLAMPCPWREEGRVTTEEEMEMLHDSFAFTQYPGGHVSERAEEEIWE
jgi:hypothetical protein